MKKVLIATTALVLSVGAAAADVTISGYGRTGIDYQEDRFGGAGNDTQVISRLRMNIDASHSSDQGVDFGARFRLQWDQNSGARGEGGTINAGQLWVKSNGLTVSVGNVGGAFDNAEGIYNGEVGYQDRSFGDPNGNFFAYNSSRYDNVNRQGVNVKYAMGAVTVEASYIDPDQTGLNEAITGAEELAFNVSYKTDLYGVAAAAALDAAGIEDNDVYYLGGWYNWNDRATVGAKWIEDGEVGGVDLGRTINLYGTYEVAPLTTLIGYIANNNRDGNETDNAFGLGATYDLGGARLSGGIERGYQEQVRADMGIRFNF